MASNKERVSSIVSAMDVARLAVETPFKVLDFDNLQAITNTNYYGYKTLDNGTKICQISHENGLGTFPRHLAMFNDCSDEQYNSYVKQSTALMAISDLSLNRSLSYTYSEETSGLKVTDELTEKAQAIGAPEEMVVALEAIRGTFKDRLSSRLTSQASDTNQAINDASINTWIVGHVSQRTAGHDEFAAPFVGVVPVIYDTDPRLRAVILSRDGNLGYLPQNLIPLPYSLYSEIAD